MDFSKNKIKEMANKTTKSIDQRIASGKVTLIKMRDQIRNINQKKEHWNTKDIMEFNQPLKDITEKNLLKSGMLSLSERFETAKKWWENQKTFFK